MIPELEAVQSQKGQIFKSILVFFASIGLCAFIIRIHVQLLNKKIGLTSIFTKKRKKIPVNGFRRGEPLYIKFTGQKSNLLSHQTQSIHRDILEV